MPRTYPAQMRQQVIELARSGTSVAQLAATFGMSDATGDAAAETQIIIDIGPRTYSVALPLYMRASDQYCETIGTVSLAQ